MLALNQTALIVMGIEIEGNQARDQNQITIMYNDDTPSVAAVAAAYKVYAAAYDAFHAANPKSDAYFNAADAYIDAADVWRSVINRAAAHETHA